MIGNLKLTLAYDIAYLHFLILPLNCHLICLYLPLTVAVLSSDLPHDGEENFFIHVLVSKTFLF